MAMNAIAFTDAFTRFLFRLVTVAPKLAANVSIDICWPEGFQMRPERVPILRIRHRIKDLGPKIYGQIR